MYTRLSGILFPVLVVALIGVGVWGYQEHQEKNSILIKAENQYQRAFHNLSAYLDQLHNELGNALAVNARSQNFHRKCLVNAWRVTSEAQNEINQLPLTLLPFHKTEQFLANLAEFTYRVAIRDMGEKPISEQEFRTLQALYKRSGELVRELQSIQEHVLNKNLRWMDVEVALAGEQQKLDNGIIDGFKLVDKKVSEYDEVDFGPDMPKGIRSLDFKKLSGKAATPSDIVKKAREFFQLGPEQEVKVTENGRGTDAVTYSARIEDQGRTIQADYTRKGGHLLWFNNERKVASRQLNPDQAAGNARQFLAQRGYKDMVLINYDEYDNVATMVMARKEGDVVLYPEKVLIKVALDNGEVLGLQARDLVFANRERVMPQPKLSVAEARERLNPQFEVRQSGLALIENDLQKEVLCYEFLGSINGSMYRLYINAEDGYEEKIEKIREVDGQEQRQKQTPSA